VPACKKKRSSGGRLFPGQQDLRDRHCSHLDTYAVNRRSRFLNTGIYIVPKYWNEKKRQIRSTHDIAPVLNAKLKSLFSFYAGGMWFGDVCLLRLENFVKGRVEYRMLKTNTPVSVPLPEMALQPLQPYFTGKSSDAFVFPFLLPGDDKDPVRLRRRINSKNVIVNKNLKKVAEEAELKPEGLSMHVARHSFADYARTRSGNLYAISKTLGHTSLQVTQVYLKSFDQDAVDQLAKELW